MTVDPNVSGFEPLYDEAERTAGRIPWDIGGPQPAVQQLVAYGAVHGAVPDPGTGPGHHSIYYASQGFSTTGIDSSRSVIDPLLEDHRVHIPVWSVVATRLD